MSICQSDKRYHFDAHGFRSDVRWHGLHRCISGDGHLISKGFRPHSPFQYLWIEEEVAEGRLKVDKVGSKENPADILTKAAGRDVMLRHLQALDIELSNTRAVKAPKLD